MDSDPADFSANIERFSGFADHYDQYRPQPPAILAEILTTLAEAAYPEVVVDLGSGTGLSARYWADKAQRVIGIEPTLDMRQQADRQTRAENVTYQAGFSHQTGLPDTCAQIVTCSQALHWMEPQGTFEEARRILVPGGVFAACDYDWPPTTPSWEADAAYLACSARVHLVENAQPDPAPLQRWGKDGHLARMAASGCFRFTKEIVLHHTERGDADRLVGLLLSQGSVQTLLKNGVTESQLGIDLFRAEVQRALGDEPRLWYWSARLRLGIV
jgi:ubiquinone/menaquinone biosynthesis C-methylase UbiE